MHSTADGKRAGSGGGLRERKKEKTRRAIQQHALRLFQEQGYDATTVEQIAEAAEVSPSTLFRYFPTKEDLVLYDPMDPLFFEAFRSQPAELNPLQAMRAAMHAMLHAEGVDVSSEWQRQQLVIENAALRARMLDQFVQTLDDVAALVAERTGGSPDDVASRATAGAILGVGVAAWLGSGADAQKFVEFFDKGLEHLDSSANR